MCVSTSSFQVADTALWLYPSPTEYARTFNVQKHLNMLISVYGHKQADINTHTSCNEVLLLWGLLRLDLIITTGTAVTPLCKDMWDKLHHVGKLLVAM